MSSRWNTSALHAVLPACFYHLTVDHFDSRKGRLSKTNLFCITFTRGQVPGCHDSNFVHRDQDTWERATTRSRDLPRNECHAKFQGEDGIEPDQGIDQQTTSGSLARTIVRSCQGSGLQQEYV
ncbi:hypothetical protein ES702_03034 [subsurface metagenome]